MGNTVDVVVGAMGYTGTSTGRVTLFTLPVGFRPIGSLWQRTFRDKAGSVASNGNVTIDAPSGPVDYFAFAFTTRDAIPATLPGVPG
ncbi:TPA: hypothetical protein OQU49_004394, partial [Shigella flexneri]|nr:hypothetical protein [Shigella flexneri]